MYLQLNFLPKAQGKPQCPHQMGKNDGKDMKEETGSLLTVVKICLANFSF